MKKYITLLGSALLGASLVVAGGAFAVHQGYVFLLTADDAQMLVMQINSSIAQAAQMGYEMCKAGM